MAGKTRKTELDIDLTIQPPVAPPPPPPKPEPEPVVEPEPAPEPIEKKPSKLKFYIIAALSSALLLLVVITAAIYFGTAKKTSQQVIEEKPLPVTATAPPKELNNLPLKPFFLPITQNNRKGFLRVKFSLLLSNGDTLVEAEENLLLIRETIYQFAKRHEPDDFKPTGKRDETMQKLRQLLDRSLQNGRVENILITEFILL